MAWLAAVSHGYPNLNCCPWVDSRGQDWSLMVFIKRPVAEEACVIVEQLIG